jgi:hypothetical protein
LRRGNKSKIPSAIIQIHWIHRSIVQKEIM